MKSAAEMIKKNNLTGVGLGNYVFEVINKTNVGYPAWYYQPVHNIYILLIAELGLAGVILLMFLFYNFIKRIIHFFYINKGTKDIVCFFLIFYIIIIGFFDHYFLTLYFGQLLLLIIFVLYYKKIKTFP
jgi:O-antigen ligase